MAASGALGQTTRHFEQFFKCFCEQVVGTTSNCAVSHSVVAKAAIVDLMCVFCNKLAEFLTVNIKRKSNFDKQSVTRQLLVLAADFDAYYLQERRRCTDCFVFGKHASNVEDQDYVVVLDAMLQDFYKGTILSLTILVEESDKYDTVLLKHFFRMWRDLVLESVVMLKERYPN